MRRQYLSALLLLLAFALAVVSPVRASEEHGCDDSEATIASLHHCVHHAIEMGHVSNAGIGNSLLVKLDAAEAAEAREQPGVAVRILEAFVNEVEAQAGVHIDPDHAEHIVMHTEMVIDALTP